ncbi:hypothetical protein ABH953_006132 [Bacillus sp. RC236]|jgi:hypothetical protein
MTIQSIIYNILSFLNKHHAIKIFIIANIIVWGYVLSENIGENLGQLLYHITH